MFETRKSRLYAYGIGVLAGLSLVMSSIATFDNSASLADVCRHTREHTLAAREAFIRGQDPLILISRENFKNEKPPPTVAEQEQFEMSVKRLHEEQARLAKDLFPEIKC